MAKPGPAPSVTPEDVLSVFAARDDPTEPLTAPEIADELGCSRSTALDKLRRLAERGDVRSKKVGGRSVVWWVPPGDDAERDVLAGDGSWTGSGLSAAVEQIHERLDEDLREHDPDGPFFSAPVLDAADGDPIATADTDELLGDALADE